MAMLEDLDRVDGVECSGWRRGLGGEIGLVGRDPETGVDQRLAHLPGIAAGAEVQQPDSALTAGEQRGELFAVGVGYGRGDAVDDVRVIVGLFVVIVVDPGFEFARGPGVAIRREDEAAVSATIIRYHLLAWWKWTWPSPVLAGLVEVDCVEDRGLAVAAFAGDGCRHVGKSLSLAPCRHGSRRPKHWFRRAVFWSGTIVFYDPAIISSASVPCKPSTFLVWFASAPRTERRYRLS